MPQKGVTYYSTVFYRKDVTKGENTLEWYVIPFWQKVSQRVRTPVNGMWHLFDKNVSQKVSQNVKIASNGTWHLFMTPFFNIYSQMSLNSSNNRFLICDTFWQIVGSSFGRIFIFFELGLFRFFSSISAFHNLSKGVTN